MPRSATVPVGKKTVMVRELILSEINELMNAPSRPIVEAICDLLGRCTDIKPEDLMSYAPSDIDPMVQKILELNQDFFAQAEALKQTEISAELRRMILRISMLAYLPSLKPDTE